MNATNKEVKIDKNDLLPRSEKKSKRVIDERYE